MQVKPAVRILAIVILFFAPAIFILHLCTHPLLLLFLFYSFNITVLFLVFNKKYNEKFSLRYKIDKLKERINVLNEEMKKHSKNNSAWLLKKERYNRFKKIIENINQDLNLDSVCEELVTMAFSLIANNKGVCLLYLVDPQTQKLYLFKSRKEDEKLIIKAKGGDIFDIWVMRHSTPLHIEDIKNDFRFDIDKLILQDKRPVSSLVSSPFITSHGFLGTLRLDSPLTNAFSQDDLRFLMTICDLGAVAIESSELFQKMQDLAIHDSLTSLYTKGYFLNQLKEEFRHTLRHKTSLSLFMIDIDFFKIYNDKFGHTAGDAVLKLLSHNMEQFLKDYNPVISRFGGEEFCVILPDMDKASGFKIADKFCRYIEKQKIHLRRQEASITVSIGVAGFPVDAAAEDELVAKADKAMYEAKQRGRNQVCCV
ncbi:MAG: sensor domain-containing diguanylate cyclase [Candidatus Omnitrophota bacterium]|jgi:diguanylate cyclase (GGDEF)-like protein